MFEVEAKAPPPYQFMMGEGSPWLDQGHPDFVDGFETKQESAFSNKLDAMDAVQAGMYTEQWMKDRFLEKSARQSQNIKRLNDHLAEIKANMASDPTNGHLQMWNIMLEKENRMVVTHNRIRRTKEILNGAVQQSQTLIQSISASQMRNGGVIMQHETIFFREDFRIQLEGYMTLTSNYTAELRLIDSFEPQARSCLPPREDPLYKYMCRRIDIDVTYVRIWLRGIADLKLQLSQNLTQASIMLRLTTAPMVPQLPCDNTVKNDNKLRLRKMRELDCLEKWRGPALQIETAMNEISSADVRIAHCMRATNVTESYIESILAPISRALKGAPQGPPQGLPQGPPMSPQDNSFSINHMTVEHNVFVNKEAGPPKQPIYVSAPQPTPIVIVNPKSNAGAVAGGAAAGAAAGYCAGCCLGATQCLCCGCTIL